MIMQLLFQSYFNYAGSCCCLNSITFAVPKITIQMKAVYSLLVMGLLLISSSVIAQYTLKGKVKSQISREALVGAFVTCKGGEHIFKTSTDNEGEFKFKDLSAGVYELTVEYVGFTTSVTSVSIAGEKTPEVIVLLHGVARELANVQVFGKLSQEEDAGARMREKRSNNIVNVISAKAMERSPDINAANVLKRMSGLTIQQNGGADEAYPIIRGLDPRYNNTLINGIKITSPDDKSRYVPLNIVPSDLLGSIEVHKSLLPDMEGDAIGGSVNMVMKDAPEKEVFKVLGSLGYNKIFIDQRFLSFSKKDIQQKSLTERYGLLYKATSDDFSRSNLDFKNITPLPNAVVGVVYGERFMHHKLGLILAENFQNQYYGSNSIFNQAVPGVHLNGAPTISDYANRTFSTQQLNQGLTAHLDYSFNDRNKIMLTNITLYSALAQSRVVVDTSILGGSGGRTIPGTGPVTTDYTSVTSRQFLENIKLEGKHVLSNHFLFDWTGVFSYAAKRTPDMADLALDKTIKAVPSTSNPNGPFTFETTPTYFDDISRIWQHSEDQDYDGMANLSYRTRLGSESNLELKTGGLYRHKVRFNKQDQYDLRPTASGSGIKQEFTGIYSSQWIPYDSTGTEEYDVNNYRVFENITAGYGEGKISFHALDIMGGVRVEKTQQGFNLNVYASTGINGLNKSYTDILPSIDLKYKLNPITNIRLAYYKAISRPNYYDLVPAARQSASTATVTEGNPYLLHTTSDNFDIRYELYPREEEQIFAGVFYKKLVNPIEFEYVDGITYMPVNTANATDYGAELAFTRYFGNFGITGNYTYLHSRTASTKSYYDLSTGAYNKDTLQKRALQGQTDHTLNLSLMYRNKKKNLFAELAFQYVGRSIGLVYPIYGYDYFQQPQSNLAFSAEKGLRNRHFTVFSKFNNLLNTPNRNTINGLLVTREITQFNFSFGLRYEK
jgi:TonB-dependent receptor